MKKVKLILIGYGNMGKEWKKIISKNKNVKLIGVVDVAKKNRIQALNDFPLKDYQLSENLETLLIRCKPDAVIDSSPPFAHFQNTKTALSHSCHVLGEKPIALTLETAKEIIQLSKTKNRLYMINQNYRRNPIIQIIKDKLSSIGTIYTINIDYYQSFDFKDTFRYTIDHPLLLDMAIHHFDLVRVITSQNADSVYASEHNPPTSKFKNGSDVFVNFRMNKGTIFNYRGSWNAVGFNTSFNGQWRIVGKYGTLIWDGNLSLSLEKKLNNENVHRENIEIPKNFILKPYDLFLYELEQNLALFVSSISNGSLPDCWCGDNINSLTMALSAIKSSEMHKALVVNKINSVNGLL